MTIIRTAIKYAIALTVIAVVMGILAGILVAEVDLSFIEDNFLVIFAMLVVVNLGLIGIAIKKGRI